MDAILLNPVENPSISMKTKGYPSGINNLNCFYNTDYPNLNLTNTLKAAEYIHYTEYYALPFFKKFSTPSIHKKALDKLNYFKSALNFDNWDGYGAKAISKQLIKSVALLIKRLSHTPEVFPLVSGGIQLEFDKEDGSYLEIELNKDAREANIFTVDFAGNEKEFTEPFDKVKNIIDCFYG
ncbi:MAG: hypothetical protein J6Y02_18030 [Pseudobutyrivibrio sp.]|nr:hypothetical protein [Pseudobutyrivibrio sp.]